MAQILGTCEDLKLPNCGESADSNIQTIAETAFIITGLLSVLFIIIGGFRFIVSGGDPNGVKSARDTVLYAVIGLVVSVVSFGIVNFVLGRF